MIRHILCTFSAALLFGCGSPEVEKRDRCDGFLLRAAGEDRSFTAADLVAHAAAMGMTQQETETLLYLEGISATVVLREGQSICIDGRPDA